MIRSILDWVDDQASRRTPIYDAAMDDRILVGFILLVVVTGILSGIYD